MSAVSRECWLRPARERKFLFVSSLLLLCVVEFLSFGPCKSIFEHVGLFQCPGWFAVKCGVGAGLLCIAWNEIVARVLDHYGVELETAPLYSFPSIALLCTIEPFTSEVLYRGFQHFFGLVPAALLYAFTPDWRMHRWGGMLSRLPAGVILGATFAITQNLWSSIIAHAISNAWFDILRLYRDRDTVIGIRLLEAGDYAGAIESLSKAINKQETWFTLRNRAACYYVLRNYDKAIADTTRAIEIGDRLSRIKRCESYLSIGETELAEQDVLCAKKELPTHGKVFQLAGYVLIQKHEFAAARAEFSESIRLAEGPVGWALSGQAALGLFKYDLCLSDCRRALSLNPDCVYALEMKALALIALNRAEEALSCTNLAVERASYFERPPALVARAFALLRGGDYEKALKDVSEAIEAAPERKDYFADRAYVHCLAKRYDDALADLERFSPFAKTLMQRSYHLGYRALAKVLKGDVESGLADAIEANNIYPSRPDLLNILGLALIRHGQTGQAVEELNRAIELDPYNAESYWFRHLAYESLGQDELASADKAIAEKYCYKPYC
ncbi:MAG: tetratricopeptide repeat protein [Candidatus Obscuribacter sp.]|nr:tetratricopeptide repeat protein [Candidatus Obscuribacter sp.]